MRSETNDNTVAPLSSPFHPLLPTSFTSRNPLRRELRERRRNLTPTERRRRDAAVVRQLTRQPLFLRSHHVALYLANDGEVDLHALARHLRAMGKRCYLPVLSPTFHNRLWFAPYEDNTRLRPNCFGIAEPAARWSAMRPLWTLDLALVPLVGFDRGGNRLGMGGGFYDRSLAYLSRRDIWRKPRLVGVAYNFQECAALDTASWDIPLDAIVTDVEFIHS